MKNFFHIVLCFIIFISSSSILARGSSSRSSSSRSSSRRSTFSSKPTSIPTPPSKPTSTVKPTSTTPAPTVTTPSRATTKPSTITKKPTTTTKSKAVSTSKLTKAKQKAMAQSNNESAKKYGTKANAEKAFREKMANSNKFTSSTPPSTKPDYVPQNVTINNTSVNTRYDRFSDGSYGYGYYDPMTHMFMALAVNQMIVDDMVLRNHGYGVYNENGRPVHVSTGMSTGSAIIIIFVIIVLGIVVYVVLTRI